MTGTSRDTPGEGPVAAAGHLSADHAADDGIDREWDQDNQQWWNWYMSLAAPEPEAVGTEPTGSNAESTRAGPPAPPASLRDIEDELRTPLPVPPDAIARFHRDGYVKLRDVVSAGALARLREVMDRRLVAALGEAPGLDFRSAEMGWLVDDVFRAFVLSERLGGMAAALLGVDAVRLYHDNALSKEPGCGRTPWHYDADHFPLATRNVCTVWIPLQPVPRAMGPLAFAVGMDRWELVRDVPFLKRDTSYDARVDEVFRAHRVPVDDGPFELGEVSFHHALSFHTAASNRTDVSRMVLATTYFEDGARVVDHPTMVSGDWRKFMPGVEPGQAVASDLNPIVGRHPRH